ncbi:PVC-type heme-binding CxxCH protein [Daejeonella sp.]|uniref:PVC-type heme-binding CxxCH protein n=1 Tax=Daejeonella sp. TaxID=2805397 RepID=UPI003982DFF4
MKYFPLNLKNSFTKVIGTIAGCCTFLFFVGTTEKEMAVQELDGLKVPEGFAIERAVDPRMISYPMFASFDGDGRLFVFESDGSSPTNEGMLKKPPYHIRLLEDTDGNGKFDKSKIFADSLSFPKGGVFYNGSLYVSSSPDLLRLTDTDGDGVADKREVVLTGWVLNSNGALLGGPFLGPDGWLYLTDARRGFNITTKEGENLKGSSARIWRCRPDGSGLESMAGGGFDNSIELAFMPSGETVGTMTYFIEPQAGVRDAIMHWVEGGTYPKYNPVIEKDKFILTGDLMPVMNKMARVSPSGIMRYRGNAMGKEFQGNLFSAEFNTGRIIRHKVIADGSTYKTVDEPFVTSSVQDMHLTDVLEDADGSMLVIDTGGWFILGCPLSRIAKLDVPGGIYRIRKTGCAKVNDPWGTKLNLRSMSVSGLINATTDYRIAVRDNAIELLIDKKEAAVLPIKNSLQKSASEEMRAAGIFALSRIATSDAMNGVRTGLADPSALVRTSAARALGLAKDKAAVDKLMELVQKERFAVRRQAATALGQIGDKRAVPALLKSAMVNNDRVEEHAIIYALIKLNAQAALQMALKHPSSKVKRTALTALDQLGRTALKKENLSPFLTSKIPELQKIGIWVASHHPEWSDIVISFLKGRLDASEISGEDVSAIRNLMITFSNDKQLQMFLSDQLGSQSATNAKKIFLLDVITHASVKEIPEVWIQTLAKLLDNGSPEIKSQVLGLVESRRIKALNNQLSQMVQNVNTSPEFRLKALSSKLLSEPSLSDGEFSMVYFYLSNKNESPIRQMAARVLSNANLTVTQLVKLAAEQIAKTDVYLLSSLISAFKSNKSEIVGAALIVALGAGPDRLDNVSEEELKGLLGGYPQKVKSLAEPLMARLAAKNAGRLLELTKVEASLTRGDVAYGAKIFFGKGTCSSCHAVAGKGAIFGPDLTNIGGIRSGHDILEAILYPSASFAREYETSRITTKTTTYTGVLKEQMSDAVIIEIGPGAQVRIPRTEITGIEPLDISLMPPALEKQLSPQELSDLMAYLNTLPDGLGNLVKRK